MKAILRSLIFWALILPPVATAESKDSLPNRCKQIEAIHQSLIEWQEDLHVYLEDRESLSWDAKFEISKLSTDLLVQKMIELRSAAKIRQPNETLQQAQNLLRKIEKNQITRAAAAPKLGETVKNLEDGMRFAIYDAKIKQKCKMNAALSENSSHARSDYDLLGVD